MRLLLGFGPDLGWSPKITKNGFDRIESTCLDIRRLQTIHISTGARRSRTGETKAPIPSKEPNMTKGF